MSHYPTKPSSPVPAHRVAIGIDNGISGGLAAVCPTSRRLISVAKMPTRKRNGSSEPDVEALHKWMEGLGGGPFGVWIEEPLKHAKSAQAVRSMALCFGMLVGALDSREDSFVVPIQVRDWQDVVLGPRLAGNTKTVALKRALETGASRDDFVAGPRCRTPHDGIVDAYLIALYGTAGLVPDRNAYRRAKSAARKASRKK